MRRFVLTIMLLLACSQLRAQEFAIVGDWANRDPCDLDWWGFTPTIDQWALIDALNCNWLKIVLDEHGGVVNDVAILGHNPPANPRRYIVERVSMDYLDHEPDTYSLCTERPDRPSALTCYLGRYVRASMAIRLQPESEFDYTTRNELHGRLLTLTGAESTPYLLNPPAPTAIISESGFHTAGIIVSGPAENGRPHSELASASAADFDHLVVRASLLSAPPVRQLVYTVWLRYWDGAAWQPLHSVEVWSDDFAFPVSDLQELTYALPELIDHEDRPYTKDIVIEWNGNVTAQLDWIEICSQCSFDVLHETDPTVVENDIRDKIGVVPNIVEID